MQIIATIGSNNHRRKFRLGLPQATTQWRSERESKLINMGLKPRLLSLTFLRRSEIGWAAHTGECYV